MRIAFAQLNYKLGDFQKNFEKIARAINEYAQHADLIIFSELCLSGYYPKDLISSKGFIETQNQFLEKIQHLTKELNISVVLGFVGKNLGKGKPYHNSLCLLSQGKNLFSYHKKLLPVYDIFDEPRHFAPGIIPGIFTFQNVKLGFLICEDGWAGATQYIYDCDPVIDLIPAALDLIICINGSPSNIGKQMQRITHFSTIAHQCQAPLIFVNQIGANDDIVFDGASFVLDKEGSLFGALPAFKEEIGLFSVQNKKIVSTHLPEFSPTPDLILFYEQIILGLKDYVEKCHFKTVVVGVSGGIDSALTLALAVKALGASQVVAIYMPSRYSSETSLIDSRELCHNLGIQWYVLSIEPEFQLALSQFENTFHEKPLPITEQNIQARLRGRILMEYSNQTGALVLSTGNKSELSVGYTTLYGDMTGGFNLIGDLYKTEVYLVAEYFNRLNPQTPIPLSILQKAPTAELAANQKDSDTLPEYALLDPILKLYLEGDLLSPLERQTYQIVLQKIDPSVIDKVHHLVDGAEFKRRQATPIVRVQRRAFGSGRQFPIAAVFPKN